MKANMKKIFLSFLLITYNVYPMEDSSLVGRTSSAPSSLSSFTSISSPLSNTSEYLQREDFDSLKPFITTQSFILNLKKYIREVLLNDPKINHLITIITHYKSIIIKDILFMKDLIRTAFEQNVPDFAFYIFSLNQEPLLSSFLPACAKEKNELFTYLLTEYHDAIEKRESPIARTTFVAQSPLMKEMIEAYPTYFEKNGQSLFENALSTYHMKTVARLSRHCQISIPEDEINQCFIHAAQQNCLSFFALPQIKNALIPETTLIKALKAASKHNHNQAIYFIFKNYNISVQTLCNSLLKAVRYNQTNAAKQLSTLITQQYQTCTMNELEEWYEYANETYSQALKAAFINQNPALISLILNSPLPLTAEILSTLIEQASGTSKKQLMKKAMSHLPQNSRKNLQRMLPF